MDDHSTVYSPQETKSYHSKKTYVPEGISHSCPSDEELHDDYKTKQTERSEVAEFLEGPRPPKLPKNLAPPSWL